MIPMKIKPEKNAEPEKEPEEPEKEPEQKAKKMKDLSNSILLIFKPNEFQKT